MDATLDAIASQSGMAGTFALKGVAEFEVRDWQCTTVKPNAAQAIGAVPDPIERLERISATLFAAADVDALLEQTFTVLAGELGLQHAFLLLTDGAGERLYNVASHGFEHAHFGSEIAMGEGIYGTAAARQTSIRTGSMRRERRTIAAWPSHSFAGTAASACCKRLLERTTTLRIEKTGRGRSGSRSCARACAWP
jgi:adenylate cyclase